LDELLARLACQETLVQNVHRLKDMTEMTVLKEGQLCFQLKYKIHTHLNMKRFQDLPDYQMYQQGTVSKKKNQRERMSQDSKGNMSMILHEKKSLQGIVNT
jgi:hypothetical protein